MNWKRYVLIAVAAVGLVTAYLLLRPLRKNAITIRVIGEAVSTVDAIEKVAQDFTRETGIKVVVEKYEFESALEKSTLDLTSKTGTYDIVLQYGVALGRFATQGSIFGVDELEKVTGQKADFEDDLFPNAWHELSWFEGAKYGYPFAANTMYVWYRKDLLDNPSEREAFRKRYGYDLGPPEDWKKYQDLAEFFTRPRQGFYGTILQGKRHPAVWYEWLNFAFSFGGGVMEKEHAWQYGPIIINSPETIQATDYYKSLKKFSPPGITNFTWDDALAEMQQGHIFMCIMWSDAVFGVEDPKSSTVVGKVGFVPLPAGKVGRVAQIAGGSYFVSRYSKHPKESFQFVLWMMKRENQIKQELAGGASGRRSVYDDTRVLELPYARAHTESLSVGRHMTDTVPETSQISDVIEVALSDVLSEKKTSQQALDWAAIELNKILGSKCPLKYQVAR